MKIIIDSCTGILLAKASVIEIFLNSKEVAMTKKVYEEIIKGKDKMFEDALLIDRLKKENKIALIEDKVKLTEKLIKDFNMGGGEASSISVCIEKKLTMATDNLQGRKAAKINNLPLVGSPEIIVNLFKNKRVDYNKAIKALTIIKKEGWFEDYLIEKAKEDLKNE